MNEQKAKKENNVPRTGKSSSVAASYLMPSSLRNKLFFGTILVTSALVNQPPCYSTVHSRTNKLLRQQGPEPCYPEFTHHMNFTAVHFSSAVSAPACKDMVDCLSTVQKIRLCSLTDLSFESRNVNQLGMGYWMPVQTHVFLSAPNQYPETK